MTVPLPWRKSSFSGSQSACVEMSRDADGRIFVRNSNNPDAGTLTFTASELQAWLEGCAAGEFNDFV